MPPSPPTIFAQISKNFTRIYDSNISSSKDNVKHSSQDPGAWWMGQIVSYLLRPRPDLKVFLSSIHSETRLHSNLEEDLECLEDV